MEKKVFPTQVRLTQRERDFLLAKGKGNLSRGFRAVFESAGFSYASSRGSRPTRPLVRRDFNFETSGFRYIRIQNQRLVNSYSIIDEGQAKFILNYGEEAFYEGVVLAALFPSPEDQANLSLVAEIKDAGSDTLLWARSDAPGRKDRRER